MIRRVGKFKGFNVYADDDDFMSFGCADIIVRSEAGVAEPELAPAEAAELGIAEPVAKPAPKESEDEIRKRARRPPSKGPCVRCGENKAINRLMLCYPCWVKTRLEEGGWKEGQPHPKTCKCGLDCAFESPSAGN